jgi:TatD DNase family protein
MPVVVHNRDSDDDVARLMMKHGNGKGVLHCFASDLAMANKMVRAGYLISFTGIATFDNKTVVDTIKGLQLNYMMVETDSPFLAPIPVRGKTNEPAYVRHVAEKIAELKNTTIQEVERITTHNAAKLFSLPV